MPDRGFGNLGQVRSRRGGQQGSAERQQGTASSIGQKAEVADTGETSREHVFEEPAQKDLVRQGHHSLLAVMSVVLPAEADVGVGDVDEPMVGDRDPMGVASQIVQTCSGPPKGGLA